MGLGCKSQTWAPHSFGTPGIGTVQNLAESDNYSTVTELNEEEATTSYTAILLPTFEFEVQVGTINEANSLPGTAD